MASEQQGVARAETAKVEPATGKLGIMVVGLGAVATTMIAGVDAVHEWLGGVAGVTA